VSNRPFLVRMNSDQTPAIEVVVNGAPRTVPEGLTLLELLKVLGLDPGRIAVELDRRIVSRQEWPATPIRTGARLEIVQFVGGG
jgi:thiamine biosynthesis protein ThiS